MASQRQPAELPACYAMVHDGLEDIAAEEIAQLGGKVKRSGHGIVVFRFDELDRALLRPRTTDDVFLYAWGTDELCCRAMDLESIERWTDHVNWDSLLKAHHVVTPKPKGKPTYHF